MRERFHILDLMASSSNTGKKIQADSTDEDYTEAEHEEEEEEEGVGFKLMHN